MAKAARVIGETLLARGRFDLTRTEIEVVEDDGSTRTLAHEVYRHGKAAAVLLYDPKRARSSRWSSSSAPAPISATERWRRSRSAPACWTATRPRSAPSARRSRRPASRIRDAGPRLRRLHEPGRHDGEDRLLRRPLRRSGPGRATAAASTRTSTSRSLEIPFAEALAMIESGAIADAKTIALLYYAKAKGLMG